MEASKKLQQKFFLVIATVIVLGGLGGLANIRIESTFITILNRIRDAFLAILQIVAILLILILIIAIVRWLLCKRKGCVILPFAMVPGDDKDHKGEYDGKSISDSFTAELLRILKVYEEEEEKNKKKKKEKKPYNPRKSTSLANKPPKDSMDGKAKRKPLQALPKKAPPSVDLVVHLDELKNNVEPLNQNLPDVTMNLGGVTLSITQLLITLKKLLTDREPESVISGSLQRFGALARLVVHLERRGHPTRSWEISREIKSNDEILNIVKDMAFKMWKNISNGGSAKTWVGLKHFIEALDSYQQYKLTGRDEHLERARNNCLDAALAEQEYKNLFQMCYNLGNTYFDKRGFESAEKLYKCAIEIHSGTKLKRANAFNGYGASLYLQKKYAEAERAFYRAIKLKRNYSPAYINLSIALAEHGYTAEAKATILKARDLNLLTSIRQKDLGDLYAYLGFQDEAIETYRHAIEAEPKDSYPHYRLGNLYADMGKTDKAIAEYQRAIELAPEVASPHNDLGVVYANLGRNDEAIAEYQRAIELDQEFTVSRINLGTIYFNLSRANDAIAEYQRAIELDPQNAYAYSILGYVYSNLGRNDEAILAFQRAIELDPGIDDFHFGLGDVYRRLKLYDKAIAEYQSAIKINAQNPLLRAALAACYRRLSRDAEYAQEIKIARELPHDWTGNEYDQACFEALCGNVDEALKLLQQALEKKQTTPEYARRDIDFEFIREDPRFKTLTESDNRIHSTSTV
jgi:tetratricopeptide (TPR) repeat protein